MTPTTASQAGPRTGPASVSYDQVPYQRRTWHVPGVSAEGEVTLHAGKGRTAKGMTWAGIGARDVLGLPKPGEPRELRRPPARVLWVPSGTEDDPIHDLSWRFAAALRGAAAEFGLDPDQAVADGLRYFHNLSEWPDGAPFALPRDLDALAGEVAALNELDAANRPPGHPDYAGPGPRVALVVLDPLMALLADGVTIRSPEGARRLVAACQRTAHAARVALVVICHVTDAGKIAGSVDLVNAARLAFTTVPDAKRPGVLVLTEYKSNISKPADLRFTVIMDEPDTHVAFIDPAADQAPEGSLRARIAEASGEAGPHDNGSSGAVQAGQSASAPGGPWRVLATTRRPGAADDTRPIGETWPSLDLAREVAGHDARGAELSWQADPARPGNHVATIARGEELTAYVAYPA